MKVLFLAHRLPYAPNRGDRIRAFHIIKQLAVRADVHVVSLVHDRAEQAEAATLERLGVQVSTVRVPRLRNLVRAAASLFTNRPLTHLLLEAPGMARALEDATRGQRPDVVFAYCSGVAPLALAPPLADLPLVLDFVDIDSAKWAAFTASASPPRSWIYRREARCLSGFEAEAARIARASTVVNTREQEALLRFCPDARVHVVPNGVDVEAMTPTGPPAVEPQVVFTGIFNYAPNADGAQWFAREVWPRVRAAVPQARLTLAGAHPTRAIHALARADESIEVTGAVPDMRPYLWRSAIAVAPIFQARGVQNKVLEAVAAGLPSVVTQAVWDGLPADVLPACRQADNACRFAREVVNLLAMAPAERRRIAATARLVELSWPLRLAPLMELIENAAGPCAGDAPITVNATSRSRSPRGSTDRVWVPTR
ncbi:MAG: TIGR03087 family PEP-CTERM/XrtA system glycosyltransferase [Vicinamibacterales bacterium]